MADRLSHVENFQTETFIAREWTVMEPDEIRLQQAGSKKSNIRSLVYEHVVGEMVSGCVCFGLVWGRYAVLAASEAGLWTAGLLRAGVG